MNRLNLSPYVSSIDKGIVLVWDLDKTLVANYFNIKSSEEPILNTNALDIIYKANQSGKVSAILLLTNNEDQRFVSLIHMALIEEYNARYEPKVRYLFDLIWTAEKSGDTYVYPRTNDRSGWAGKSLNDVEAMLMDLELPIDNLASRVYFFDDLPNHVLAGEIPKDHYIVITPPFDTVLEDATDYSSILDALSSMNGGRMTRRRYKGRANKKCSRRLGK